MSIFKLWIVFFKYLLYKVFEKLLDYKRNNTTGKYRNIDIFKQTDMD